MKKKKLFAVAAMSLAILMTASLSGCGKDSSSEDDVSTSVVSEISDESSDVESEPETEKPKKEESSKKEQSSKKRVQRKKAPKVKKFLHHSKKQWTSTKSLWTSMLIL